MENGGAHVERHLFVAVAQIAAIHAYLQEQSNRRDRHMPKYVDNLLSRLPIILVASFTITKHELALECAGMFDGYWARSSIGRHTILVGGFINITVSNYLKINQLTMMSGFTFSRPFPLFITWLEKSRLCQLVDLRNKSEQVRFLSTSRYFSVSCFSNDNFKVNFWWCQVHGNLSVLFLCPSRFPKNQFR
jgi:hypothetical protein